MGIKLCKVVLLHQDICVAVQYTMGCQLKWLGESCIMIYPGLWENCSSQTKTTHVLIIIITTKYKDTHTHIPHNNIKHSSIYNIL